MADIKLKPEEKKIFLDIISRNGVKIDDESGFWGSLKIIFKNSNPIMTDVEFGNRVAVEN